MQTLPAQEVHPPVVEPDVLVVPALVEAPLELVPVEPPVELAPVEPPVELVPVEVPEVPTEEEDDDTLEVAERVPLAVPEMEAEFPEVLDEAVVVPAVVAPVVRTQESELHVQGKSS